MKKVLAFHFPAGFPDGLWLSAAIVLFPALNWPFNLDPPLVSVTPNSIAFAYLSAVYARRNRPLIRISLRFNLTWETGMALFCRHVQFIPDSS